MKWLTRLVFFIIIVERCSSIVIITKQLREAFDQFAKKFNKTYPSTIAREKALLSFAEEFTSIQLHNIQHKLGLVPFERRINHFSDATLQQKIKNLSGLRVPQSFSSN